MGGTECLRLGTCELKDMGGGRFEMTRVLPNDTYLYMYPAKTPILWHTEFQVLRDASALVSAPRLSQTHAGKPILQHIRAAPHERGAWTSVRAGH